MNLAEFSINSLAATVTSQDCGEAAAAPEKEGGEVDRYLYNVSNTFHIPP